MPLTSVELGAHAIRTDRAAGVWAALYRQRWVLAIALAAFAVRLHWALVVHPLGDYVYSDMNGYAQRADQLFDSFTHRHEYAAFYPYGTHVLAFAVEWVFGRGHLQPVAVAYAVMGTVIATTGYLLARRVSRYRFVPEAVGLLLVFYYPLISLGGYFLSETPFAFTLVPATYLAVRLLDPRLRYPRATAFAMGTLLGVGIAVRPQMLISIALFGAFWVVFRKRLPTYTPRILALVAVVPALVLAFSSARLHYHTGRYGLVSENGYFNKVYGRCHNQEIVARAVPPRRGVIAFSPPPMIQLGNRDKSDPDAFIGLDPALGLTLEFRGYISDQEALEGFVRQCVEKTGMLGQLKYTLTNVLLLWRYNVMWPDSGTSQWRVLARRWGTEYANWVAIPSLLGLLVFVRAGRNLPFVIVALHLVAVLGIAILYWGDPRLRAAYDPFLLLMAAEVYAFAAAAGLRRLIARARGEASPWKNRLSGWLDALETPTHTRGGVGSPNESL